jgi:amino acid transporter
MLKIILSIVIVFSSTFALVTSNAMVAPYLMILIGLLMLVLGLEQRRKGKKGFWYISIIISLFSFFVSIQFVG